MLIKAQHLADVVEAMYGFTPHSESECVQFQLVLGTQVVDVIMSVETTDSFSDDREFIQTVRMGLYFLDGDSPLDFAEQGLTKTLLFLHRLQHQTHHGSLRVYEGKGGLEVYLYHIVPETLSSIRKFLANVTSCPVADALVFLTEEWEELNGVLNAFAKGSIRSDSEFALASRVTQGSA